LIDEVLAVGDADFQRKCYEYFKKLKRDKKTVVFVSHNMTAVREFCTQALLMDNSQIVEIGDTDTIARKYNELFIDDIKSIKKDMSMSENRWGDKRAEIKTIISRICKNDIMIEVGLKVNEAIDKIKYGIHVVAPDGTEVLAMNNEMINRPDIIKPKKGDNYIIRWKMLNIFNDGQYAITITLVDDIGSVIDWWLEASKFTVRRVERSTTAVFPPLEVILIKK